MEKTIDNSYIKFSKSCCDDTELVIDDVFVPPRDRGQGIGKKLVKMAIQYARDHNYETVGLYAEPQSDSGLDGEALVEFYLSIGFESDACNSSLMTFKC